MPVIVSPMQVMQKNTDLFYVKGIRLVKSVEDLPTNIYKNINTTEIYVEVNFDTSNELDSSSIHSAMKAYTPATRYDAQYIDINEIVTIKQQEYGN